MLGYFWLYLRCFVFLVRFLSISGFRFFLVVSFVLNGRGVGFGVVVRVGF